MFGLENNKKEKPKKKDLYFDLEIKLNDETARKEIFTNLEKKMQRVKELMRLGENKTSFDRLNALHQGYSSAIKVLMRIKAKKNALK